MDEKQLIKQFSQFIALHFNDACILATLRDLFYRKEAALLKQGVRAQRQFLANQGFTTKGITKEDLPKLIAGEYSCMKDNLYNELYRGYEEVSKFFISQGITDTSALFALFDE